MNEIETFIVEHLWHGGDIFDQPPAFLAKAARVYQADKERFNDLSCIKQNGMEYFLDRPRDQPDRPSASVPAPRRYKKRQIRANLRLRVYARDGFKCLHCGISEDLTCDHIIAESKGGATNQENLQTLCRKCNTKKGAK